MRGMGWAQPQTVQAHPVNCGLLWNTSFRVVGSMRAVSHRPDRLATPVNFKLHHYHNFHTDRALMLRDPNPPRRNCPIFGHFCNTSPYSNLL